MTSTIKRLAGNGYRDRHHSQTAIRGHTNMPKKKQRRFLVATLDPEPPDELPKSGHSGAEKRTI